MSSQQPPDRIDGPREAAGRMANEPKLGDPRPRERRRNRISLGLLSGGMALGAGLFALVFWIIAMLVGQDHSAVAYIVVAAVGAGVGAALLPYLTLVRQDGRDAEIVKRRRRGRADTPIEGAEAVDEGRTVRSGGHR
jgi:hypothetical protein